MTNRQRLLGLTIIAIVATAPCLFGGTQAGGTALVVLSTPAGALWTWGTNGDGQLGNTTTARRYAGSVSGFGTITPRSPMPRTSSRSTAPTSRGPRLTTPAVPAISAARAVSRHVNRSL